MSESSFLRSSLDSDRFGIEVFRASIEDEAASERAIELDRHERVDLLISRVACERLDLVRRLCAGSGFVTDTLVYYRGKTGGFRQEAVPPQYAIRLAGAEDRDALERLSRAAFAGFSGHYHADPRLDSAAATEAYVDWCVSSLTRPDHVMLLGVKGGEVAGFVLLREYSDGGEIVLNAVAPAHQSRGLYGALVGAAGCRLKSSGREHIYSSTQITNLGPQKVWSRFGMGIAESYYTFHHWFAGGAPSTALRASERGG